MKRKKTSTIKNIQKNLMAFHCYYQSKCDITDQFFNCVAEKELYILRKEKMFKLCKEEILL